MELFAGFEADGLAWGDADFGAGSGVAADACFTGADAEDAEAAQLDAIPRSQRLLEPFEDGVHGGFRFSPRQACPLDDVMHNILLDQCLGPFIEEIWENLAPAKAAGRSGLLARCYWELAALSIFAYSNTINNLETVRHKEIRRRRGNFKNVDSK